MQVPNSFVPDVTQSPLGANPMQAQPVRAMRNAAPEQMEQMGAVTQRMGQELTDVAIRAQSEIDSAKIKAAESEFIQNATDAQSKYLETSNADALAQFAPTQEAIVKAKQDASESLDNDVQRNMFNQLAQRHLVAIGAQMGQHQAQQRKAYNVSESAARADSMRTMAQNVPVGSEDQNNSIENGVAEVRNVMSAKGFPDDSAETVKAERDYRTQIVGDNVNRLMVDGKYDDAKTLLSEQMKAGNVDPDAADHLRSSIESNVKRVETDSKADAIYAAHKGTDIDSLEAMLADADKITDPDMRKDVRSQVSQQFSQARSIEQQAYNENLGKVENYKAEKGTIRGVDPVMWGKLDAKDREELSKPPALENNVNVVADFILHPENLTVDKVQSAWSRGQLSKGTYLDLLGDATKAQSKPDYVQEASAINERVKYFANQAGLNVYGKQSLDEKQREGALVYKITEDVDRLKAQQNGKATPEQVDKVIQQELIQRTLTTPRSPWNPIALFAPNATAKKFNFEMPAGATHVAPGSDGNLHYTDGQNDLGVVK